MPRTNPDQYHNLECKDSGDMDMTQHDSKRRRKNKSRKSQSRRNDHSENDNENVNDNGNDNTNDIDNNSNDDDDIEMEMEKTSSKKSSKKKQKKNSDNNENNEDSKSDRNSDGGSTTESELQNDVDIQWGSQRIEDRRPRGRRSRMSGKEMYDKYNLKLQEFAQRKTLGLPLHGCGNYRYNEAKTRVKVGGSVEIQVAVGKWVSGWIHNIDHERLDEDKENRYDLMTDNEKTMKFKKSRTNIVVRWISDQGKVHSKQYPLNSSNLKIVPRREAISDVRMATIDAAKQRSTSNKTKNKNSSPKRVGGQRKAKSRKTSKRRSQRSKSRNRSKSRR